MQERSLGELRLRIKSQIVQTYTMVPPVFDSFKGVSVVLISSVMSRGSATQLERTQVNKRRGDGSSQGSR